MEEHVPVLLAETIEGLNINPSGIYVDLTIGRGGHSKIILSRLNACGYLIGFDQDDIAIEQCKNNLAHCGKRFTLIHDNFKNLKEDLHKLNIKKVDGFLMDLGVSSPQFDDISRGFSYKERARLDMRMDRRQTLTAETIVNEYSIKDLTRIFRDYGEDKYAYQIAKKVVAYRENKNIEYTDELVEIIKSAKPMKELAKKGHPAKQIFQALRIEVNDEFGALKIALHDAMEMLNSNGRIAVISFHSLEDKIVKEAFKNHSSIEVNRKNSFLLPSQEEKAKFRLINKKIIVPTEQELNTNHRSHSAKLRIIEKI